MLRSGRLLAVGLAIFAACEVHCGFRLSHSDRRNPQTQRTECDIRRKSRRLRGGSDSGEGSELDSEERAQMMEALAKLPHQTLRNLDHAVSYWNHTDFLNGEWTDTAPSDAVGMKLDEVWEGTKQLGIRVGGVKEGATPAETGGVEIGDWLVSVDGIDVSQMCVAEVGELMHMANPEKPTCTLRLRHSARASDAEDAGEEYNLKLSRQPRAEGGEQQNALTTEDEALEFLEAWRS